MKKQFAVAVATLATVCAFGQGVTFNNNAATVINESLGVPAAGGSRFVVELFYGALGTAPGLMVEATTPAGGTDPAFIGAISPGRFSAGARDMTTAGQVLAFGATATFQVRAWDGTFGQTYAAFWANPLTATQGALYGASLPFDLAIQASSLSTAPSITTAAGYQSFVMTPVPEPSVIALGVLGALALLFRRRK